MKNKWLAKRRLGFDSPLIQKILDLTEGAPYIKNESIYHLGRDFCWGDRSFHHFNTF